MGFFSSALTILAVAFVPTWLRLSPPVQPPSVTEVATCICKYEVAALPSDPGWSDSALITVAAFGAVVGSVLVLAGLALCPRPGPAPVVPSASQALRGRAIPRQLAGAISLGEL